MTEAPSSSHRFIQIMKHSFLDSAAIAEIEVCDDMFYVSFRNRPTKSYEYSISDKEVFQKRITDCIKNKASIGKTYHSLKNESVINPTAN